MPVFETIANEGVDGNYYELNLTQSWIFMNVFPAPLSRE